MSSGAERVWLMTLRFGPRWLGEPVTEALAFGSNVRGALTAVREGRAALPSWPFTPGGDAAGEREGAPRDVFEWLAARTEPALSLRCEEHLVQAVHRYPDEQVVARYLFDAVYAATRPELHDREHVMLLHGILAAKIVDDDAVILEPDNLAASLRWRKASAGGSVRFTRGGGRER